ncbi:aldehyde dehydrogenase family protein [Marinicella sp. W31]|uniref:aldehyde dehydrogenase family protein n=1 Tax=Marinicella sp. W31 TaxID=3023713 RepID=UPI003756D4B0
MLQETLNNLKSQPAFNQSERIHKLKKLRRTIRRWQPRIIEALHADFSHRAEPETYLAEIMMCLEEINHCIQNIPAWMRVDEAFSGWKFFPSKTAVSPQPLGVVGIMSPWNYPFNLAIAPLIIAITAGNRAMLKPSEVTEHTSALIKEMLAEVFSNDEVVVCLGGVDVAISFSELKFDHLLFTGSTQVGRQIMQKASQNLVPVTLELGGKSPVLIGPDYSLRKAARAIVAGKYFNAGQTCIAPDYILIDQARMNALANEIHKEIERQYPDFVHNKDYSSIINQQHYLRLSELLEDVTDEQLSHNPENSKPENRRFQPLVVKNIKPDQKLMQDEIFGPILPLMSVESMQHGIDYICQHPRPLTLYVFSNKSSLIREIREKTHSGSLCVNETLVQFAQKNLPFGGVGDSGMGRYHGYSGFIAMSHMKSVYYQSRLNFNHVARAPFTKLKRKILSWL